MAAQTQSISKGQIVRNTQTGVSGVVVGVWTNQWTGQTVLNVRVPGTTSFVMWVSAVVEVVNVVDGVVQGDTIFALDDQSGRHVGLVVGKTLDGRLIAQFSIGQHIVHMDRVWRVIPSQFVRR